MRIWCMTNLAFNLFFQQYCFNVRDTFYSIITTIQFSVKNKTLYYWRYIDDIFALFKSSDHLKQFQSYLNFCHVNISFTIETKQNNKISFLDVNVICEQGIFLTSVYRKSTFNSVHGVLHGASPFPLKYFYSPIQSTPLDKKHHVPPPPSPPLLQFFWNKSRIPWFTDTIYKIIWNFSFLKTSPCLSS